ncbi:hypothetical protein [Frankia sp. Cj3]|uniref:hypothetical protein n=1 Tax=Frankia sp. Cj3 TaxID=2880976 RepID=UPI001EF4D567|nr:hypothetical protein [Frankia sp. Cj3]
MTVRIVWNDPGLFWLLASPAGPVGRSLALRGHRVLEAAREQVGVGRPDPLGRQRSRSPGALRASLRMEAHGAVVRVGSSNPIALLHHEGTRPHAIYPRRPGGRLVFYWDRIGGVAVLPMVHHPGTAPNRYLTDNLHLALLPTPRVP